jgi:manganese/zinc/iron transport system permease protein
MMGWTWSLDGWIIVVGMLCAVASSLIGNFLVLRRMSLLGDAISHAVLPGLAVAFLITSSRNSLAMFAGAVVVGILTALLTQWIRDQGSVDEGAAMGVVFTTLFAIGLVMIVQAADHVDLDAGCVLYGAIELTPLDRWTIAGFDVPRVAVTLSVVCAINLAFVVVFFKELKLTSFDPALATTVGINAQWMHYVLMTLVAITAVACFESVGNILVIAMMIVPTAAALMLSDRLGIVMLVSAVIAASGAVLGHVSAIVIPSWFGMRSTTTAGMMAVVVGAIFTLVLLFAPQQGVVVKLVRRRLLTYRILGEDILAALFRAEEQQQAPMPNATLSRLLFCSPRLLSIALWWQAKRGLLTTVNRGCELTELGRYRALKMVRSHRLWEYYLANEADVDSERLHSQAERLEHFTDDEMQHELDVAGHSPSVDPHGRAIPIASSEDASR